MSRLAPVLLALALTGCVTTAPEVAHRESRPGGPADVAPVAQTQVYALHRIDAGRELVAQVQAHKGSQLGFRDRPDGARDAVAGERLIPLPRDGVYRWEIPDSVPSVRPSEWHSGYSEPVRAAIEQAGTVVAVPFMAAAMVAVLTFGMLFGLPMGH